MPARTTCHALGLLLVLVVSALGQPPADSLERDYRDELPRVAARSPEEALATFRVAPGFRLEQVAAEPLVTDPVAIAFDEDGRLFVAEMRGYSEDQRARLGRITCLEDTDGDGRCDRRTIYAEDFAWPTALFCYAGGLYVADAPDLVYLADTDGDQRADRRQVVFTGFGTSNVQGLLNTLLWGLDNRIYGSASSCGGDLRPANDPAAAALSLRGRDFAFDPRTHRLEAVTGGGQHGMSFDAWGNRFVCSNSDHLQLIYIEDHYLARNPNLAAPAARRSIAADGPQADVFRISPVEPWRIVRTRLRKQGIVPGPLERGGAATGYFTSATGVTIYQGNAWPPEFEGWVIIADVGSNLVHRKRLEPQGVGFVGRRVDRDGEFLASTDNWFRPVQFANGPDGALYVVDMYREVIEHPASLPPVIKQHLDLTSGRDRGRIYRVVGESFSTTAWPRLGRLAARELVPLLAHDNAWQRDTAARLLYERQDRSVVPALEQLAATSTAAVGRMRALYVLSGLQSLTSETLLRGLRDTDPRVREHALRLSEPRLADSVPLRAACDELAADPDLRVRYQLALSAGAIEGPQRISILAAVARQDAADPDLRTAIQSSVATGCGLLLAELAADRAFSDQPAGDTLLRDLARQIGRQQEAADVAALLALLPRLQTAGRATTVATLVTGLALPENSALRQNIDRATGGQADQLLTEMLVDAAQTAADLQRPEASRREAIHLMRLGSYGEQAPRLLELLAPDQPQGVQQAALQTLSTFDEPALAGALLERWPQLSPRLRSQTADVLATRTPWLTALLDAATAGTIAGGDLDASRLAVYAQHRDAMIRERAAAIRAQLAQRPRQEVIDTYRPALAAPGDPIRGKEVFTKICAACHQLDGRGNALAPNLAAMRDRGAEAVLVNVLDPNREVNPQFVAYLALLKDGRQLSGMITAETATSLTLTRAEAAQDTVLRADIEELRSSGMSLMPEGLEKQIEPTAMADLIAYLQSLP